MLYNGPQEFMWHASRPNAGCVLRSRPRLGRLQYELTLDASDNVVCMRARQHTKGHGFGFWRAVLVSRMPEECKLAFASFLAERKDATGV